MTHSAVATARRRAVDERTEGTTDLGPETARARRRTRCPDAPCLRNSKSPVTRGRTEPSTNGDERVPSSTASIRDNQRTPSPGTGRSHARKVARQRSPRVQHQGEAAAGADLDQVIARHHHGVSGTQARRRRDLAEVTRTNAGRHLLRCTSEKTQARSIWRKHGDWPPSAPETDSNPGKRLSRNMTGGLPPSKECPSLVTSQGPTSPVNRSGAGMLKQSARLESRAAEAV